MSEAEQTIDPWDTPFWRFVRETAAQAEAMPHWKWPYPRDGCECEWCKPKRENMTEREERG
jgi:hypothetical protein